MEKMSLVREGKRVSPYCLACGCRLKVTDVGTETFSVEHFPGSTWLTDARECACNYIASVWSVKKEYLYSVE